MTILFVCSGNTCRSPLAVAAWRHLQRREKDDALRDVAVISAGLSARKGALASPRALEAARGWNVNLETHRARVLAPQVLQRATLICPMTSQQALSLRRQFPEIGVPIIELGRYETQNATMENRTQRDEEKRFRALLEIEDDSEFDIADPFGGSHRVYRECGAHILRCVRGLRLALRDGKIAPDLAP